MGVLFPRYSSCSGMRRKVYILELRGGKRFVHRSSAVSLRNMAEVYHGFQCGIFRAASASNDMKTLCYPGTDIPVRRGDLVRWCDDVAPSTVLFVVSTNDFPDDEDDASRQWYRSEFGAGIMLNTPSAGLVLESEDCESITLMRAVGDQP